MSRRAGSVLVLALAAAACSHDDHATTSAEASADALAADEASSGPSALVGDAAAPGDAETGPRLYALKTVTPIFNKTEFPPRDTDGGVSDVVRVGYLRKGSSARYKGEPQKKPNCSEGWYELADGGFLCGKFATTDPKHPDLADAPHAPSLDKPLPYEYGMNMGTGVPLYFRIPTAKEREKLEANVPVSNPKDKKKDDAKSAKKDDPKKDDGPTYGDDNPYKGGGPETSDAWYLQPHTGEKPKLSLDDLRKTERGDLIERRMVKGFYLALDITLSVRPTRKQAPMKFWRTTRGLITPFEHILVHDAKVDLKGVWLDGRGGGEKRKLPLAIVSGTRAHRYKITMPDAGAPKKKGDTSDRPPPIKTKRGADLIERFTVLALTGKSVEDDHWQQWYELDDGSGEWVRGVDVGVTKPGPRPKDVGDTERWIDVNEKTQSLVAFEGDTPVFATLVSTGRHDDDAEKDHHTPKGDFRIREKHIAATMEEDTATDGPYSIEDVPWIMYFHGGYALHGAFWHSRFGHERSHGCVNLAPTDARELFGWVGPRLPEGWHGVRASDANPGTRVIVHD